MRVIFDTNVLVSRLLAPRESLPAQAVPLVMEGANVHLFSEATFQEFGDVLSRDPRDDKFLDLAVCGNADYLVTGDENLLALHPFEGVSILSPASFLSRRELLTYAFLY